MKWRSYHEQKLKDPEYKKEWDALEEKYELIDSLIKARAFRSVTQSELADAVGMSQADISKIEQGKKNPSLKLLERIAEGLDMDFNIVFTPKSKVK
jgi:transcriptional regulator with XRE-family HTH domain